MLAGSEKQGLDHLLSDEELGCLCRKIVDGNCVVSLATLPSVSLIYFLISFELNESYCALPGAGPLLASRGRDFHVNPLGEDIIGANAPQTAPPGRWQPADVEPELGQIPKCKPYLDCAKSLFSRVKKKKIGS